MSDSGLTEASLIPTYNGSPFNDVQVYLNGVATGNQGTPSAAKTKIEAFMMGSFSATDNSGEALVAATVCFNAEHSTGLVIDADGSKRVNRYDATYGKLQSAISMFSGCTGLVRADLQGLPNVAGSWGSAFAGFTRIKEVRQAIDYGSGLVGKENTITLPIAEPGNFAETTSVRGWLSGCTGIENFTIQDITPSAAISVDMSSMFANCTNLKSVSFQSTAVGTDGELLLGKTIGSASNLQYFFQNCSSLKEVDLNGIGTSAVAGNAGSYGQRETYMYKMFDGCTGLVSETGGVAGSDKSSSSASTSTSGGTSNQP